MVRNEGTSIVTVVTRPQMILHGHHPLGRRHHQLGEIVVLARPARVTDVVDDQHGHLDVDRHVGAHDSRRQCGRCKRHEPRIALHALTPPSTSVP